MPCSVSLYGMSAVTRGCVSSEGYPPSRVAACPVRETHRHAWLRVQWEIPAVTRGCVSSGSHFVRLPMREKQLIGRSSFWVVYWPFLHFFVSSWFSIMLCMKCDIECATLPYGVSLELQPRNIICIKPLFIYCTFSANLRHIYKGSQSYMAEFYMVRVILKIYNDWLVTFAVTLVLSTNAYTQTRPQREGRRIKSPVTVQPPP